MPVSVKMPKTLIELIDELIKKGYYQSRSEFIRQAVIEKLREELKTFKVKVEDFEEEDEG